MMITSHSPTICTGAMLIDTKVLILSYNNINEAQNLLSEAPPCFGRHVKPLVPAAFAVVSTDQPALGPCGGLWLVRLMCNPQGRPVSQQ
jgi:hypothetical protein